jgi:hypothetical protein
MRSTEAILAVLVLAFRCTGLSSAETLYDVDWPSGQAIGAFDANILADDAHLPRPAVVTHIDVALCIKGQQDCSLWLFGGLQQDALRVIPFTNQAAASQSDFFYYSFDMEQEVPKDFYIGFSAQGDGWGVNLSDSAFGGGDVMTGIASNENVFYYGSVAGGRLTKSYQPAVNAGFFTMTVSGRLLVPSVGGVSVAMDGVQLLVTNLCSWETNVVQRSGTPGSNGWDSVASFVCAGGATNWTGTLPAGTNRAFYRVLVPTP